MLDSKIQTFCQVSGSSEKEVSQVNTLIYTMEDDADDILDF